MAQLCGSVMFRSRFALVLVIYLLTSPASAQFFPFAFIKSVVAAALGPRNPYIKINADATYANSTAAELTLSVAGATQMYITTTAGCASGGTWEALSSPFSYTLNATNGVKTVYVKFRDASLNESICTSDTITLDTVNPTTPGTITLGSVPSNLTETPSLTFSASTDTTAGINYYEAQLMDSSGTVPQSNWVQLVSGSSAGGITLVASTNYTVQIRAVDRAGNVGSARLSSQWTSAASAGSTCSGTLSGGICYFSTASGTQGCTAICTGKGGVHPATTYLIGATGTNTNCTTVLTALPLGSSLLSTELRPSGCFTTNGTSRRRGSRFVNDTAGAGAGGSSRRACACYDGSSSAVSAAEISALTVLGSNSTSSMLRWTRAGDGNMKFQIAYQVGASSPANCTSGTIISSNLMADGFDSNGYAFYTVTGLSPATQYSFRVCAIDASGVHTTGLTATATTDPLNSTLAAQSPSFVNATSNPSNTNQNFSFSHVVSGANRLLLVHLYAGSGLPPASSITYNGVALTRVGSASTGAFGDTELWALVAPPVGSYTVDVALSGVPASGYGVGAIAATFEAVHQTTPYAILHQSVGSVDRINQYITGSSNNELVAGFTSNWNLLASDVLYSETAKLRMLNNPTNGRQALWTAQGEARVHLNVTDLNRWISARVISLKPIP